MLATAATILIIVVYKAPHKSVLLRNYITLIWKGSSSSYRYSTLQIRKIGTKMKSVYIRKLSSAIKIHPDWRCDFSWDSKAPLAWNRTIITLAKAGMR